jgi:hypothetical protein
MEGYNGLEARNQIGKENTYTMKSKEQSNEISKADQCGVPQILHLLTSAGFNNMHVEQVQVPPVADGAFSPAAVQSKPIGAEAGGLVADDIRSDPLDATEKSKLGKDELGITFTACRTLSK